MPIQSKKVAVIGAGPMGLAVAYQLVKDGFQPVIFEADDRIGGMSAAFDFGGLTIERYYHFLCTSDRGYIELIHELGLSEKLHWCPTKMGYFYKGKTHPWGNPWALMIFPHLNLLSKFRYALHMFLSIKRKNWKELDHLHATQWLKSWVGNHAFEVLWKKLFEYKFYKFSDKLSAAWIWSRIHRVGNSRYNLLKEKFGYLEGGSITLLDKMREYIENHGGEIRLSNPIQKILIENGSVRGVLSHDQEHAFSRVICTVPLPYVSKLIPNFPKKYIDMYNNIENIAVVCVIVKLKKNISGNFWLNVNDPTMDIPGLVEYTNLYPMRDTIVYVPFYMPGDHPKYLDSNDQFKEKVRSYIQKINPNIIDRDFIDIFVSRYKYSQPVCPPGFLDLLPPVDGVIKGLSIADTSYYYPQDRGISESIDFGRKMAHQVTIE